MVYDVSPPFATGQSPSRFEIIDYIRRFERRAQYYLLSTLTIGATIFLLLFFAGYVFFFARDIEGTVNTAELLQRLQTEKSGLEETEKLLQVELNGITEEERVGQRTLFDVLDATKNHNGAKAMLAMLRERERLLIEHNYFNESGRPEAKEELTVQTKQLQVFVDQLNKAASSAGSFNVGGPERMCSNTEIAF